MTPTSRLTRLALLPLLLAGLAGCDTLGIGGGGDGDRTPTVGNRIPILSRIGNEVTADSTLANVSIVLPPAQDNVDWAQAGGTAADCRHDGANSVERRCQKRADACHTLRS